MSRLKKFTRSLASGYVLLGANIFYTLAGVPLALHYLGKLEFGLWALVTQIGGYIALIDFGMSNSVSRFLIDHKDDRQNGAYGSVIKTSVLVGGAQGVLIILAGVFLSVVAGPLLHISADFQRQFVWLMIGQSVLLALSFIGRVLSSILLAHQQPAISCYGAAVMLIVNLAGMWAGLAMGWGVYSFLIGQALMTLGNLVINAAGCIWLGLLPKAGEWGAMSRARFQELFAFGRDSFLMGIGWQFISASQTILLTRFLGLETAAIWSVCTRTYTVVIMLISRIFDFSFPALTEMMVRDERERLFRRFREITGFCASVSLVAGTLLAVCNGPFVWLWTGGKIHWPPVNDLLLAILCFVATFVRPHTGLATQTKRFGFLRFIFLVEGLAFVGLNLLAHRVAGMTTMLIFSIVCTLAFTLPYGLWRTCGYCGLGWRELAGWYRPTWHLTLRLVPVALGIWWLARGLPAPWQLTVNVLLSGLWGGVMLLRHGLGEPLQAEIIGRAPGWLKAVLKRLMAA
ncbi:MAG: oligosaccharide flippase family protein [Verrucomicrobiales bacterium]|nr:oligosaccharide flippase family protein [Verrucomicrobiales bacterium]